MKVIIKLEVTDAIRAALQRHNESKSMPTKGDVTVFLTQVCKAAIFSIVEHEDVKRMKKPKPKKAPESA